MLMGTFKHWVYHWVVCHICKVTNFWAIFSMSGNFTLILNFNFSIDYLFPREQRCLTKVTSDTKLYQVMVDDCRWQRSIVCTCRPRRREYRKINYLVLNIGPIIIGSIRIHPLPDVWSLTLRVPHGRCLGLFICSGRLAIRKDIGRGICWKAVARTDRM